MNRAPVGWWFEKGAPAAFRLSEYFRPALRAHFARLSTEDLLLRFGSHCRPEVLDAYIAGIDFRECVVLGVFSDDLELVGTAHLISQKQGWELGLSVLADARNRGIGTLLLRRSIQQARLGGANRILVHCLSENHALMRLVRKVGAEVVECAGEADGIIALSRTLPFEGWTDWAEEQLAVFRFGLNAEFLIARLLMQRIAQAQ